MRILPRLHLFEWEDQDFCPRFIRDALTNYLNCVWCVGQFYRGTLPVIRKGLQGMTQHRVVDLCSGGGGAIPEISKALSEDFPEHTFVLSDYFPNQSAFEQIAIDSKGRIDYLSTSVDARTFQDQSAKMYTMFLALHHFTPEDVTEILRTRTGNGDVIAIFEIQQRTIWDLFLMLAHIPLSWLVMPFLRPTALQLIFTYLIPVIPLLIVWDGMVSTLRTYSKDEIVGMLDESQQSSYTWEFGRVFHPLHSVSYCLGMPNGSKV